MKDIPNYNFFYWGPLLLKIKLHVQDLKKCSKLCSKKSKFINDTLAGVIKHEHAIKPAEYHRIINPYLDAFSHGYKEWYGQPLTKKMTMSVVWVNFMVAGEFNPPHMHNRCDFSSVLFVKIPEKLKEEHKKFQGRGGGPGALSFMYSESQPYSISSKDFFPEEGEFFIFPATLSHFVAPFKSKGERITISANFRLN